MKPLSVLLLCVLLCQCSSDQTDADPSTQSGSDADTTTTGYVPTAAGVPSTDIFLAQLDLSDPIGVQTSNWHNVTDRDGYDNQPQFTADGTTLVFTSVRDGEQSDIYRYDIETGETTRVTETADSEFSPTPMPGQEAFSAIRETPNAQWLWHYGLDGESRGILIPDVTPIGYHAWASANVVGFFLLGSGDEPATLQLIDLRDRELSQVATNIGRSLNKIPGRGAISFVDKSTEPWLIKAYDWEGERTRTIVDMVPGSEDYAWAPDTTIFMGSGSLLHQWTGAGAWRTIADLAEFGVEGISRLAISPDGRWIAVVSNRSQQRSHRSAPNRSSTQESNTTDVVHSVIAPGCYANQNVRKRTPPRVAPTAIKCVIPSTALFSMDFPQL